MPGLKVVNLAGAYGTGNIMFKKVPFRQRAKVPW